MCPVHQTSGSDQGTIPRDPDQSQNGTASCRPFLVSTFAPYRLDPRVLESSGLVCPRCQTNLARSHPPARVRCTRGKPVQTSADFIDRLPTKRGAETFPNVAAGNGKIREVGTRHRHLSPRTVRSITIITPVVPIKYRRLASDHSTNVGLRSPTIHR